MIELYGKHFIYDGVYSSQYNLIIANVETSRETRISGEKTGYFVFNKASKSNHLIDDDYSDSPMSFDIEVVTCDGTPIDLNTMRKIERWLFTNSTFKKLYVDPVDDKFGETYEIVFGSQKSLYFNCRFLNPEKLEYNNGIVGFKCTLETDSMMLWQDEVSASFDFSDAIYYDDGGTQIRLLRGDVNFDGRVTARDAQMILVAAGNINVGLPSGLTEAQELVADMNGNGRIEIVDAQLALRTFSADICEYPTEKSYVEVDGEIIYTPTGSQVIEVPVDSDIDRYTYPIITICMGDVGGTLTFANYNDDSDRVTEFSNLPGGSVITIDSVHSRVLSGINRNGDVSLYNMMTKKRFPRLVEGDNQIVVTGNLRSINIAWQNRRFL